MKRNPFQIHYGDDVAWTWPMAMRRAAERARRTGRRHVVRRSDWTRCWLVQEIR